jgi:ribosomal protein L11 methyltransferase
VRLDGPEAGSDAEWLSADAWSVGVAGVEEVVEDAGRGGRDRGTVLVLYVTEASLAALQSALEAHPLVTAGRAHPAPAEAVAEVDWSEEWKRGLAALVVGDRLVVRPSFVDPPAATDASLELVIDPGQAFGTGHHASTRLALECLADPRSRFAPGQTVLDVGTGTGVLALAALRLGAGRAVGLDLDPLSPVDALRWARRNGLADRCDWLLGPIDALAGARFDWVLANLIRTEMEPIVSAIAAAVAPGGQVVLSGLLRDEQEQVSAVFAPLGLTPEPARHRDLRDATGDHWIALVMSRPR